MCGIVGAVAKRPVANLLLDGLKRLEYRGYDSAGIAVVDGQHELQRLRVLGKVRELESALEKHPLSAHTGIAHTRWATHGVPSEMNAHPFVSGDQQFALVHNGIIENYAPLKEELKKQTKMDHLLQVLLRLLMEMLALLLLELIVLNFIFSETLAK